MSHWQAFRAFLLCVCFMQLGVVSRAADPTQDAPFAALQIHGVVPDAQVVYPQLVENDESIRGLLERIAKDRTPDGKLVGRLYVQVEQFRRWLHRLELCNEPAAVDFRFREAFYGKALSATLTRFWGTPQSGPLRQRILVALGRSEKTRIKKLQQIAKTLQSGEAEAAEKLLDALVDDVYATAGLLSPNEKKPVSTPISPIESEVRAAMSRIRSQRARAALKAESDLKLAEYKQLIADVADGRAMTSTGTIQVGEKALDGPAAAAAYVQRWRTAHLGLLRAAAIQSNQSSGIYDSGYSTDAPASGGDDGDTGLSAEAENLANQMMAALGEFVAADIGATPQGETAKEKFFRYTQLFADLSLRTQSQSWLEKVRGPMLRLATKSGMRDQVIVYSEATADLLRWRERAASAQCVSAEASLLTAAKTAKQSLVSKDNYRGMYVKDRVNLPLIMKPIPDLIPELEKTLIGNTIAIDQITRLDSPTAIWMSRFDENFYIKLDVSAFSDHDQVRLLAQDLMLNNGEKPLTIDATAAMLSARNGHYARAAGKVAGFTVEGAAARYATLPSVASGLIPIGAIPPRDEQAETASTLAIRLDVEPKWVQHRYFFIGAH